MTEVNVILDILKALLAAAPDSTFINSLHQQYCNRGGLSRKQLEGLYSKASKLNSIPPGKLATLEAIIKKKPVRERAAASKTVVADTKDESTGLLLQAILDKYPAHKRILFLKSRYDNQEILTVLETEEIYKLSKILLK